MCRQNPQLEHLCEWCRGTHRSIHCPHNPSWVPNSNHQGKGKNKGGKDKGKNVKGGKGKNTKDNTKGGGWNWSSGNSGWRY